MKANTNPEDALAPGTTHPVVSSPNVILELGKAKLAFDKPEIGVQDLLSVYEDLADLLRLFHGVYI